ncbi:hypothetical protein OKW37_000612 [Paraburkholderia sp. MM5482-R2]
MRAQTCIPLASSGIRQTEKGGAHRNKQLIRMLSRAFALRPSKADYKGRFPADLFG